MGGYGSKGEGIAAMNRFYVDRRDITGSKATIRGEDVKHITKVLRLGIGDTITVCDGNSTEFDGKIEKVTKETVVVRLCGARETGTEPPVKVTLFQSIPKGSKMDLLIQKGTELGIASFVPVFTSRTVVKLKSDKDEAKKVRRWQRIAEEAAKQSRRGRVPEVLRPVVFSEALRRMEEFDLAVMPVVAERDLTLSSIPCRRGEVGTIAILIGPEGGFDEREFLEAKSRGIYTVKLGPRILRTETAGLVLTSIIMYRFGDLGGLE